MSSNKLIKMAVLGCLSTSLTFTAMAESQIEEIIVTATKREQTLQEVPIAVSVTDAETIEKAQILDILDLQSVVPSLRITQLQSSSNTNFVIRGFGNGANNAGIEPSVGVFIDGVYRSRSAGAISDLPNLQRVEVLRGPQSTLFGKNASAGVISVVTAKPSYDFGGSAEVTVGNYGLVAAKGDVTGGLTEDLAYSLSGNVNQRDGYFEDFGTGIAENDRDRFGMRGQLLWTPSDAAEFRLIADFNSLDEICCGVSNLLDGPTGAAVRGVGGNLVSNSPFAYQYYSNTPSVNALETSGVSLHADIGNDEYDFVSITSLREQKLDTAQDSDFTSASLIGSNTLNQDIETFTQEFRLSSAGEGNLDWMVGAFFFEEDVSAITDLRYGSDIRSFVDLQAPGALAGLEGALFGPAAVGNTFIQPGQGITDTASQENSAASVFAQFDWYLSDNLTATFGLNHTRDEKEVRVTQENNDIFSSIDLFNDFGGAIPQAFFAQTFFDLFGVPATPANVGFIESLFPGTFDAITAGVTSGIQQLQGVQFLPQFVGFPNPVEDGLSDESATTYTLRFAYDVNDSTNVYVSSGTGFKATSWNLSRDSRPFPSDLAAITAAGLNTPNLTTGTRFAGPEDSNVIEIGLKTKFDRGALNIAAFNQVIEGFQSNIFTGAAFSLANAGKQSTLGFEFDSVYNATDNLTLNIAGTYLSAKYDSFTNASGIDGTVDLSGQRVNGVHPLSLTTSATYDIEFANGWTGFIRGDYLYESNVQMLDNVPASLASRQVNTLNASFGIETVEGWNFTLWGRNVNNDQYLLSGFPSVAQAGSFSGYPNQPRTYGLTVKKSF
ncbi:MAG: TonB-dependent receptor [Gammaproteobacteria bacterium]|nr:TonB-dependent receptor [Gammaproteobacteria bacterium]